MSVETITGACLGCHMTTVYPTDLDVEGALVTVRWGLLLLCDGCNELARAAMKADLPLDVVAFEKAAEQCDDAALEDDMPDEVERDALFLSIYRGQLEAGERRRAESAGLSLSERLMRRKEQ